MESWEDELTDSLKMVAAAGDLAGLESVRVTLLGKKGLITQLTKSLGGLPPEERKIAGQKANALKDTITTALEKRKAELESSAWDARLAEERIDITLPVRPQSQGRIHPISRTIDEVIAIFGEMGLSVAEGPDIETDWHNFTALNIPMDHPARQEHDTFYLPGADGDKRKLLRTHTSPVQIRTMLETKPPIRIIVPGRTYRCDYDATHSPMFHQVEGLVIDENTHMGHLKGCLIEFCRAFFGVDDLPVRFRPSYFPFTEPSAEVDIGCTRQGGEFRIGRGDDWLEILGCGMVNPNVLENCNIDSTKYQGFAFGLGIERIAMLKYGIPDLRTFFESDLRWLRHYGFSTPDIHSIGGGMNG
ncbi:MAG: phenylalanine--tRNA ligase subunit alpha [Rhodospirillales bacterium RIFCSPLOWO2_12_FULL_58_28]|nr:MAG: phenylalanine--tRNA ligase subunit alpha [Rhodospirillales bacterium RIFCSPLOWO2_02_FULL_58_16]OHC79414.1 MAG: phenylalanine--tRNA ligase subunit alpha [Rhodospirillales bacterium RIFCSPLOWO2_12_FULL_58_28]